MTSSFKVSEWFSMSGTRIAADWSRCINHSRQLECCANLLRGTDHASCIPESPWACVSEIRSACDSCLGLLHTHTRLTALFPGIPGSVGTRKEKPVWILKQEIMSGIFISWAVCKSAPRSRQITTPAPHHSVFYRPDALSAAQPTASKHWRQCLLHSEMKLKTNCGFSS